MFPALLGLLQFSPSHIIYVFCHMDKVNYQYGIRYNYVRAPGSKKVLIFLPPRLRLPDSIYVARIFICLNYE